MNSSFFTVPASASTVASTSRLGLSVGLTPRAAIMSSTERATMGRGVNLGGGVLERRGQRGGLYSLSWGGGGVHWGVLES